ncbi:toxin HicA [beta proteobacterium AAP99]|nr:toxin HicA [beta proteobacterium AAP99]
MPPADRIQALIDEFRSAPAAVKFRDLAKVCEHFFGPPRISGSSHHVYKTPWAGDPRVNIQRSGTQAKAYQVRQVLAAIDRLASMREKP